MFFGKKNEQKKLAGKNIVMVGTSSALMFLASEMINQGAEVCFFVNERKKEQYKKTGAFSIKKTGFQTKYCNFEFVTKLKNKPDCCFVGSEPDDFRQDVLLLVEKELKNVPIINLSGFGNGAFIKDVVKAKVFNAVFSIWANREKTAITICNKNPKIEIEVVDETDVDFVKSLLDGTGIDTCFFVDMTKVFWKKKIAFVLANMLMIIYNKPVAELLKDVEVCEIVRKAAKEWEEVLKKKDINISVKTILPEMSNFEQDYKSEFLTQKRASQLIKMIDLVDKFETPQLFELVVAINKKF